MYVRSLITILLYSDTQCCHLLLYYEPHFVEQSLDVIFFLNITFDQLQNHIRFALDRIWTLKYNLYPNLLHALINILLINNYRN